MNTIPPFLLTSTLLSSSLTSVHSELLLNSLPSPSLRKTKQKSNDVFGVFIELIPFRLALSHDDVDGGDMQFSDLRLQQMNEVLSMSAADMLNVTYVGRCQDVELDLVVSSLSPFTPAELSVRTADRGQWFVDVKGNVTFSGSYYLDDPESEEVTWMIVESWANDVVLMETLSSFLCSERECLQSIDVEMLDAIDEVEAPEQEENTLPTSEEESVVTVGNSETGMIGNEDAEKYQDNLFDPVMAVNEMDLQTKDNQQGFSTVLSRNAENSGNIPKQQNHAAWIVPVALVLTLSMIAVLLLYRRRHRRLEQPNSSSNQSKDASTLEASPPSSPLSILRTEADKAAATKSSKTANSNCTSFHQKSIDQLLQEFTNDDNMSLVSDPSTNDASEYSVFSGFSHDLLSESNTKRNPDKMGNDTLNLKQAALTSSTLHNDSQHSPTKNKNNQNSDKSASYLPSPLTLQKQESFEGKYRTISAMASVLRKDILHVAGETGEDSPQKVGGTGGRTSSPRKSMEMMERQRMRERGLFDHGAAAGDIASAAVDGVGRVGIRPAKKEELEKDKVEIDEED